MGEKASGTYKMMEIESGKESGPCMCFFQLIAFRMIYNAANYALDFDFCNEFTFRRQPKHVMNGRNQ